jgi:pimeloyl-ACP methyl ester carboxylesterase
MSKRLWKCVLFATVFIATTLARAAPIGAVVMHGKGGGPTRLVADLAAALQARGYLVANLEMPWSGQRHYDVDVATAEQETERALASLRGQGAGKVFIIGHSQGGLFALYLGGAHKVDGIVAIAPGGNVAGALLREKTGAALAQARSLLAEGKGDVSTELNDYEGARGSFSVRATPAHYISWFDPEGAMNQDKAVRAIAPGTPVLYIAPTGDYPALSRANPGLFAALPRHPMNRFYAPSASHKEAPTASVEEIVRWTGEVAGMAH